MIYTIEFADTALRDLENLPKKDAQRLLRKIPMLANDLAGDVKRLTRSSPEYRLRMGNYRVLFDAVGSRVIIYRVAVRRDVYDR